MGDKGRKDKGKKEQQKKVQLTLKEKRKKKRDKKNKKLPSTAPVSLGSFDGPLVFDYELAERLAFGIGRQGLVGVGQI